MRYVESYYFVEQGVIASIAMATRYGTVSLGSASVPRLGVPAFPAQVCPRSHPNIMQIYGVASGSNIRATIFHDGATFV
jgi:hypothetical protein